MVNQLLPINNIQREDVLAVAKRALRAALDTDLLEDFLSSVDWSGVDRERPEIADLLGQMEDWAAKHGDGRLTRAQYVSYLLSLLPEGERGHYYVLGGGTVSITVSALPTLPVPLAVPGQSPRQPQTGSGTPPLPLVGEGESGTVLSVLASF